jgi:hypothetical protein
MAAILDHLDKVSVFGPSVVALFLILGLDWVFTGIHTYQEWRGEAAPLWRVFGAVVGLRLPNLVGFLLFTVTLTLVLWGVGLAGITGWLPCVGQLAPYKAVGALGVIIGARLADTLISHWGLYALGYRPNPGLKSTPLYVLEAVFILLTFWRGLAHDPRAALCGFAIGAVVFILVLPTLWVVQVIALPWRRERWMPWQPLPAWAMD